MNAFVAPTSIHAVMFRDVVNACWRQVYQLAVWHVMHQAPCVTLCKVPAFDVCLNTGMI